jgi:O-antigen/teichoic acid export membrane protein
LFLLRRVFAGRTLARELIRNNLLAAIGIGYDVLLAGILSVSLGRILGPEIFGQYVASQALVGLIYGVANLGVAVPSAREVAKNATSMRTYMGGAFAIHICITGPLTLVSALALSRLLNIGSIEIVFLIVTYVMLSGLSGLLNASLQALDRFGLFVKVGVIYKTFWFGLNIVTLIYTRDVIKVLLVSSVVQAVNLLVLLRVLRHVGADLQLYWNTKFWRTLVRESLPIVLSGSAEYVNLRADSLMVGALNSARAAGIYGAAYNLYVFEAIQGYAVAVGAFPTLSREAHRSSVAKFQRLLTKLQIFLAAYGICWAVVGIIVAPQLVYIFYGGEYLDSATPFMVLSLALPFIMLNRLLVQSLNASHRQRWTYRATLGGALFNITSNLLLIPRYGYSGAAVVTVLTEGLVWIIALFGLTRSPARIASIDSHNLTVAS